MGIIAYFLGGGEGLGEGCGLPIGVCMPPGLVTGVWIGGDCFAISAFPLWHVFGCVDRLIELHDQRWGVDKKHTEIVFGVSVKFAACQVDLVHDFNRPAWREALLVLQA